MASYFIGVCSPYPSVSRAKGQGKLTGRGIRIRPQFRHSITIKVYEGKLASKRKSANGKLYVNAELRFYSLKSGFQNCRSSKPDFEIAGQIFFCNPISKCRTDMYFQTPFFFFAQKIFVCLCISVVQANFWQCFIAKFGSHPRLSQVIHTSVLIGPDLHASYSKQVKFWSKVLVMNWVVMCSFCAFENLVLKIKICPALLTLIYLHKHLSEA